MNDETKQSEPDVLDLIAEKHAEQEKLAQQAGLDQSVSCLLSACQSVASRLSEQRKHNLKLDPTIAFCVGAILSVGIRECVTERKDKNG